MICQILRLNLPTCRTAMSRKTAASTMIAKYVMNLSYSRMMSIGISFLFSNGKNVRMPSVRRGCVLKKFRPGD